MLNKEPLFLQYNNQGGHATWYPRYLCLTVHHLPMSKLAQVNEATDSLANWMWTTVPQFIYYRLKAWNVVSTPLRASNLLLKRYSAQNICTSLCFRTTLTTNAAPPREREGFSETDSTQYCNSRNTQNREEAQLLAAPPMHQIQPNGSIKDYLRHTDVNKEHKQKTSKVKHPEGWSKKKHRSERKLYYSKSISLYFAFMNIVLEIHKLITSLPKF